MLSRQKLRGSPMSAAKTMKPDRPGSQRFGYFGEVRRIVWIKTAIPRSLFYGRIGRQQHRHRIADWIIISYPRKRSASIAHGKDIQLSLPEIGDQGIDRLGRSVLLPQYEQWGLSAGRSERTVPYLGCAIA